VDKDNHLFPHSTPAYITIDCKGQPKITNLLKTQKIKMEIINAGI